jgi:hypothetical protein
MFVPKSDLQFLFSVFVLGRPFPVVFPRLGVSIVVRDRGKNLLLENGNKTHFMISLSLMIRLISSTMRELTHTVIRGISLTTHNAKIVFFFSSPTTNSLFESNCRYGSSSCWHTARWRCVRPPPLGSRILHLLSINRKHIGVVPLAALSSKST